MAEQFAYTGLEVVARHEPVAHFETDANGIRREVELPGFTTIGVLIDGHFVGLGRYHTTDIQEGIERAGQAQAADEPTAGG